MAAASDPLYDLTRLTGDRRQFACVRRIILDEGPERGVAALAFSTGGGLDFWVLLDRAMDIGPLWLDGRPVAWQSPAGFRHPALVDPDAEEGYGFSRGFSGFLATCGLDHTRHPAEGRPHHGRLPFLPARLTACGEAFDHAEPHLFCEGELAQWKHGGENLAMIRRIEAPVGGRRLAIRDRVVNRGGAPQRHALLYHVNIGHPFLRPGARIVGSPSPLPEPIAAPHADTPSTAACLPVVPDRDGRGALALERPDGAAIRLSFPAATLPFAQTWTDLRPGVYVASLEPCTDAFGEGGRGIDPVILAPGESREYALDIAFEGRF
jgi:hypothetical protein